MTARKKKATKISNKISGIYGILNTQNGKWYVGQSVDVKKRWRSHRRELSLGIHPNAHLQSAFSFYGNGAFSFELLEECAESDLDDREIFWIDEKGSYLNGYNLTTGGNGTRGLQVSDEMRRKMSMARRGRKHSEQTIQRIREGHINSERSIAHMKRIKETKRLRSVTDKEREHLQRLTKKQCKPVLCVETGVVYESAHEAARAIGSYQSNISACCRGKTETHRGYRWRYI